MDEIETNAPVAGKPRFLHLARISGETKEAYMERLKKAHEVNDAALLAADG